MKQIHIWMLILISFVISPYVAEKIHATCTNDHHNHAHKNAVNCAYSQKDLNRILTENKERYSKHCENKTCFYCGCPVADHSSDQ
jgi:hypothetical protein